MRIVQAQHKPTPPVQGTQRNTSICRQYLWTITLILESVEEWSEHTQIAAPPSLVGVSQQQNPIEYVQQNMKWGQTLELHDGYRKASSKHQQLSIDLDAFDTSMLVMTL